MDDIKSLSHSKYRCKYHIVFAPKYRRQIIYKKIKADVGKILRELSERKGVRIIEAECCPDHIHMLVEIPPHLSVASFMGYLKSKSSLMIFDKQLQDDIENDQLSLKEFVDPFTGEKAKKA